MARDLSTESYLIYKEIREGHPDPRSQIKAARERCGSDKSLLELLLKLFDSRIGLRFGEFTIKDLIDFGGQGWVYLARHDFGEKDRGWQALKIVPPQFHDDEPAQERLKREIKAVMDIDGPYLVPVKHVGRDHNQIYYTMEHMKGGTLQDQLRQARQEGRPGLSYHDVLPWLGYVAQGLVHLHERNLFHGDLKPANILLTADKKVAKLGDYGMVSVFGPSRGGTPYFMAPEQWRAHYWKTKERVDARSDYFVFGLVLHHLITGEQPFGENTPLETFLIDFPELGCALDQFLAQCRRPNPADRFPCAAEFLAAYRNILDLLACRRVALTDMESDFNSAMKVGDLAGADRRLQELIAWESRLCPDDQDAFRQDNEGRRRQLEAAHHTFCKSTYEKEFEYAQEAGYYKRAYQARDDLQRLGVEITEQNDKLLQWDRKIKNTGDRFIAAVSEGRWDSGLRLLEKMAAIRKDWDLEEQMSYLKRAALTGRWKSQLDRLQDLKYSDDELQRLYEEIDSLNREKREALGNAYLHGRPFAGNRKSRDLRKAMAIFCILSERDSDCAYKLGEIYNDRHNDFFNEDEAIVWYERAWDRGRHAKSGMALVACFQNRTGTNYDLDKARFYRKELKKDKVDIDMSPPLTVMQRAMIGVFLFFVLLFVFYEFRNDRLKMLRNKFDELSSAELKNDTQRDYGGMLDCLLSQAQLLGHDEDQLEKMQEFLADLGTDASTWAVQHGNFRSLQQEWELNGRATDKNHLSALVSELKAFDYDAKVKKVDTLYIARLIDMADLAMILLEDRDLESKKAGSAKGEADRQKEIIIDIKQKLHSFKEELTTYEGLDWPEQQSVTSTLEGAMRDVSKKLEYDRRQIDDLKNEFENNQKNTAHLTKAMNLLAGELSGNESRRVEAEKNVERYRVALHDVGRVLRWLCDNPSEDQTLNQESKELLGQEWMDYQRIFNDIQLGVSLGRDKENRIDAIANLQSQLDYMQHELESAKCLFEVSFKAYDDLVRQVERQSDAYVNLKTAHGEILRQRAGILQSFVNKLAGGESLSVAFQSTPWPEDAGVHLPARP